MLLDENYFMKIDWKKEMNLIWQGLNVREGEFLFTI